MWSLNHVFGWCLGGSSVWIGFFFVLAYVNVGKQLWMLTIVKHPGDCHVILDIKIVNDIKIILVANRAISCMMQCLSIIGGYSN
jgi:hypothetical protein